MLPIAGTRVCRYGELGVAYRDVAPVGYYTEQIMVRLCYR